MTAQPPLLDLLGAGWTLGAPVLGAAWDGDLAGFALGDGSLAMARADWEGGPELRPREGGGAELVPRVQDPPPVARQGVHRGACLALAADPSGGFLSGGADGMLARTGAHGATAALERHPGMTIPLVAVAPGRRAWAVGRRVHLSTPRTQVIDLPDAATALAFDPAGTRLAAAHGGGVTLAPASGEAPRVLAAPGRPRAMAWSPDGLWLAVGLEESALHAWRVPEGREIGLGASPGFPPRSLGFSADGRILAGSGAARVLCWRFDPPRSGDPPEECGLANTSAPVGIVAPHPARALIAAGYGNGAVLLCQPGGGPGSSAALLARGAGGGAVSALAWSADGERLAIGTEAGEAGVVRLPGLLFRAEARPDGAASRTPHRQKVAP